MVEFLRGALADEELPPSPALEGLAKLPFPLIITTNYDRLLERAFTLGDVTTDA